MTKDWKPHAKYPHVFAVIRLDDLRLARCAVGTSLLPEEGDAHEQAAEQEAARLDALNSDKNCRYVVHIAQLDER